MTKQWHFVEADPKVKVPDYIESMSINWMDGYSNKPEATLYLNKDLGEIWPEPRYAQHNSLWVATHPDGWMRMLVHSGGEQNEGGFGGAAFKIKLLDGSEKILRGPWSGGCYGANRAGLGPFTEIGLKYSPKFYNTASKIRSDVLVAASKKFLPDIRWVDVINGLGANTHQFEPLKPGQDKPKGMK